MAYKILDSEGNPKKHNDIEVFAADSLGVVKAVDMEKRILRMIGTSEAVDRDGDIIKVNGWDFSNFQKNPVILWGHDYSLPPLGAAFRIVKRRLDNNPVEFSIKFASKGVNPFADMILELFNEKIMNASSVGFLPFEFDQVEQADIEDTLYANRPGTKFTKQELLELSMVSVPANPAATQVVENAVKGMGDDHEGSGWNYFKSLLLGKQSKDAELRQAALENIDVESVKEQVEEVIEKGLEIQEEQSKIHQVPGGAGEPKEVEEEVIEINLLADKRGAVDDKNQGEVVVELKDSAGHIEDGSTNNNEGAIVEKSDERITQEQVDQALVVLDKAIEKSHTLYNFGNWQKAGAVLSKKNKQRLQDASSLILEVLSEATRGDEETTERSVVPSAGIKDTDVFEVIFDSTTPKAHIKAAKKKKKKQKQIEQIDAIAETIGILAERI